MCNCRRTVGVHIFHFFTVKYTEKVTLLYKKLKYPSVCPCVCRREEITCHTQRDTASESMNRIESRLLFGTQGVPPSHPSIASETDSQQLK